MSDPIKWLPDQTDKLYEGQAIVLRLEQLGNAHQSGAEGRADGSQRLLCTVEVQSRSSWRITSVVFSRSLPCRDLG